MWDIKKSELFNKIKITNNNAKKETYENMPYNQMLKIYTNMKNNIEKYRSSKSAEKQIIKPDTISKDYTNNWEAHEIIDHQKHTSFDIQEKQDMNDIYNEMRYLEDWK